MTHTNEHQFTPEDAAEHIRGLQASAHLIDALIAEGVKNDETRDTMDRNVRHIGIMCAMPHIQESGTDLSQYTDAQHRGAGWINA